MTRCPTCGAEIESRFRFCPFCGISLVDTALVQDVRKVVSIVFSDLAGSTALGEKLDSESLREVIRTYFESMQAALERHGGTVEKFIGDAVMAVFGIPHAHEDDGLRAVRAAKDMQDTLARMNDDLERRWGVRLTNRTGVNTGEVVAGDVTTGQRLVTGDAVNTAARLEQAAPPNQILISASTLALVRNDVEIETVEPLELKGKAERVPAFRLVAVRGGTTPAKKEDLPLVGRETELGELTARYGAALESSRSQLATLIGDPGLGKSRLIRAFLGSVAEDARVLEGTCLSYGEGITYWPIAEALRTAAGISDEDSPEEARGRLDALVEGAPEGVAERLAAIVGLSSSTFSAGDTTWAVKKFLVTLSKERPVVLVVDDVHWAESTLLEALEGIVSDEDDEARALVLCAARPEFLEKHAEWGAPGERASRVVLEPLSSDEGAVHAANILGGAQLPASLVEGITHAASGNPLFVEQVVSMMVDQGSLISVGGRWRVAPGATPAVPPSINALLAARLDALGDAERGTLQRGSVIGLTFPREAVEVLTPKGKEGVEGNLQTLSSRRLVARDEPVFGGDAYRFANGMVRETAYAALLKKSRAEMHEGYAEWLTTQAGERAIEYEEILGYHLEQSWVYRGELGPLDDHGTAIGRRAAELLGSSGQRALARSDFPAARSLLERACAPLEPGDVYRLRLAPNLAEALLETGDTDGAKGVLDGALEHATAAGDDLLIAKIEAGGLFVRFFVSPDGWSDYAAAVIDRSREIFQRSDDTEGLFTAAFMATIRHALASRFGDMATAALEARRYARAMRRTDKIAATAGYVAQATVFGPTPVPEAIALCEQALRDATTSRRDEGIVLGALGLLHGLDGAVDEARPMLAESRAILEDVGGRSLGYASSLDVARVELYAGHPDVAEQALLPDYAALTEMGEEYTRPTTAALIAESLIAAGRADEADAFLTVSQEIASEDDADAQSHWRRLRARLESRAGNHAAAEEIARESVERATGADYPLLSAMSHMDLSVVLRAAGKGDEAAAALARSLELCRAKGASAAAAYVQRTWDTAAAA